MGAASMAGAITWGNSTRGQREGDWQGVGLCMKRMQTGKPNIAAAEPGNTGGFAPRCPAWPGQHDTPGDGTDLTAELVEKAGTFQALVQLLSAAELQPALLTADAHQPAAQCVVSPPWRATEGLTLVLLGTALLHSSLLLPDRELGAPSHQAPSSHSFLGATGQCYGYPVDPLHLGSDMVLHTVLGYALVPGCHQPLHPSLLPIFKQSQHPPQLTLLQKQRNTPALPSSSLCSTEASS